MKRRMATHSSVGPVAAHEMTLSGPSHQVRKVRENSGTADFGQCILYQYGMNWITSLISQSRRAVEQELRV
jgi:hypothetical protein